MRRKLSVPFFLVVAALAAVALPASLAHAQEGEPAAAVMETTTVERAFTLENGIDVLIVSDPDLDRSAASLSVEVGSMDNPDDQEGIAHFLEHMLFLGTTKYPDSADYKNYLAQNDGSSNAYTADNITNYHFEVKNDAFEGALDRFSRFFIDPLMTDTLSEREVNAVDSEHSKNLQNEFWRTRQVYRSLLNPEHPHRGFSTGNKETLAGVKNEMLRAFYESKYSSNLMHLVILSAHPADEIESWVKAKFAEIPNRNYEALSVDVPVHGEGLRGKLVEVKSLQDVNQLWVRFEVPKTAFDHEKKPMSILGGILGHEGSESLLQNLKQAGLATTLSAGANRVGKDQGTFSFTLTLTPQGMAQLDTVLERMFGMINHLRAMPEIPSYLIEERQKMSELELGFRQRGPAMNEARTMTALMVSHPFENLWPSVYLITKPSQESIREVLDQMTPENAMVLVYSKDRETDQVEKYYQAEYRVSPLGDELVAKLKGAKPAEGMGVPAPNPFIPSNFDLVETTHAEKPWKHEFEYGEVWLRHDTLFGQPKAAAQVVFYNEGNQASARDFVLGSLYAASVQMAMTPYSYPLNEAGVNLGVSSERRGITLTASGYSQKMPELAAFAVPFLTELKIDEAQFGIIKQSMQRGLANFPQAAPTNQAFEIFRELIRETHFTPAQQAAALEPLTYADLQDYFGRVYQAVRVRAFFYGNMTEATAKGTVDTLVAGIKPSRAMTEEERFNGKVIQLKKGSSTILRRPIAANDSISLMLLQGDPTDMNGRAAVTLLRKAFPSGFYGDLRTLQQTGYIVQASAIEIEALPTVYAFSQSSVVSTDSLRGRFVAHIANYIDGLGELSDEEFEANRQSAVAELAKKSTSFDEELNRNTTLAYVHHGDFADTDKLIAAVEGMQKDAWITWVRGFLTTARRVCIQLDGATERQRFQEQDIDTIRESADGWVKRPKPE